MNSINYKVVYNFFIDSSYIFIQRSILISNIITSGIQNVNYIILIFLFRSLISKVKKNSKTFFWYKYFHFFIDRKFKKNLIKELIAFKNLIALNNTQSKKLKYSICKFLDNLKHSFNENFFEILLILILRLLKTFTFY